jgi:predicted Zn-dependent protease
MDGPETLRAAQDAAGEDRFEDALALAQKALILGLDLDARPSERGEFVEHPEASLAEAVAAVACVNLGRLDEALAHAHRALVESPGARALTARGLVRRARGEIEAALADLDAALQQDWTSAGAHFNRARCLRELGRLPEAEVAVGQVLRSNPFDPVSRALFDEIRAAQGLPHTDDVVPPAKTFDEWRSRAAVFAQRGDHAAVVDAYDHALALAPSLQVLRGYRGASLEALGELERAREDYEAYLAVDPGNAPTAQGLERVRARLRERR